jgi:hypothetical protein
VEIRVKGDAGKDLIIITLKNPQGMFWPSENDPLISNSDRAGISAKVESVVEGMIRMDHYISARRTGLKRKTSNRPAWRPVIQTDGEKVAFGVSTLVIVPERSNQNLRKAPNTVILPVAGVATVSGVSIANYPKAVLPIVNLPLVIGVFCCGVGCRRGQSIDILCEPGRWK